MHRLFPLLAVCLASACSAPANLHQEALFEAQDHVADGMFTAGIEGPAVGPDGALYAVNFEREGTVGRVLEDPSGDVQVELFVTLPEGSTGNGLRFDAEGRLLVADYTGHAILRIDPADRGVAIFAPMPAGTHQPNDIATAPDGTLYASDPDWAHDSGQLWRIDRDGSVHLLDADMGTTNGIEVSPDGRRLYVNESVQRRIWTYDRLPDGGIAGKRLLIAFDDHGLDGMRADLGGNLHVARYGAGTVAVVSPDGRVLREVRLRGAKPTNVAFGGPDGRTVYVTLQDRGAIERYRSDVPGREARGAQPAAGTPD
ncbi:SMP-30/gluconolactonase/LRE family protein [Luteimonas abyssi]|uniref:SMP-30/gluconolactonase/LRE family protein n=1 Tax=Luteimonas abyssi TaxID=1247514 RepID=UPI000737D4E0|nr:SMP-30/gluconolactonase/LRE family protein [Luteimonas abyssi]